MICLKKDKVNDIPILHVVKGEHLSKTIPTVIYYHGFNGEKISNLTLAYKIAEKGFRVILPDSLHHGQRDKGITQSKLEMAFWDIVIRNIVELSEMKEYLVDKKYTTPDRIGIGGTSMGAITTFGALRTYDWLCVAACLMGTAFMTDYAKKLIHFYHAQNQDKIPEEKAKMVLSQLEDYDLSKQPEKIAGRPLFMWHGKKDQIIPFSDSDDFYRLIKPYNEPDMLHFVSQSDFGHKLSKLSMTETANWFEKHL